MEPVFTHIEAYKFVYGLLITLASGFLLYWLSRYFATKSDLHQHRQETQQSLQAQAAALAQHQADFEQQRQDHARMRETVQALDAHIKHLPTSKEIGQLREQMALLNGRLDGINPLFKQLLNNDNMLIQNELNGGKK
ncbi:DUF2730 family protein [Bowmanella denitrificans]|uniref:DUF2730 family protein n=1 Tax=Bowmanella denitrificans TaxID=366582 RepID=UPI000C998E86|nr:DUF2730 family protein [Bowmanella denitrificans]